MTTLALLQMRAMTTPAHPVIARNCYTNSTLSLRKIACNFVAIYVELTMYALL